MDNRTGITFQRQRICAERELALRRRVYSRRVDAGQMTKRQADDETATMAAIVETLRELEKTERLI